MRLYDYGLGTLSQYDLTAERSARTRGALLCYTEQGLLILREFHGSEKKLKKQQELLLHLQANGISTDYFLENTQGSLVSQDKDGQSFTLQRWYEGQECDTRSREDIMKSVRVLAKLHIIMRIQPQDEYKEYRQRSLKEEYTRHNQELRKIRKFIRKKGPTCTFEKKLLAAMEGFLEKGEQAVCLLEQSGYEELREQAWQEGTVCHGEYNQHNVLISREDIAVTNFGRWSYDIQMADLYQFMRKILEKYNWDQALGEKMLREYHGIRPISQTEWQNLQVRFTYPEKYWKLANYYYSHKKAWISEKNMEKLENLVRQQAAWEKFGQYCFRKFICQEDR